MNQLTLQAIRCNVGGICIESAPENIIAIKARRAPSSIMLFRLGEDILMYLKTEMSCVKEKGPSSHPKRKGLSQCHSKRRIGTCGLWLRPLGNKSMMSVESDTKKPVSYRKRIGI